MERNLIVPMMLPAFPDNPCQGPSTDEQVKVSSNDTTAGFLNGKLVAGTNVSLTETNDGGNETLVIAATAGLDERVKVSANDTTAQYLGQKVQAGSDVTITTQNPGGNEHLSIAAANNKVQVSANDNQHQFLGQKLVAGTNVTLTTQNPGGNENLRIDATAPVTSVNTQTGAVVLTAADVGAAATVHTHAASDIVSGTIDTARLGSGTANSTTFLRGDQTYATPPGLTGFTGSQNTAAPNNTVNASRLLVDAATTNADAVIQPKGTGAILAQLPDGTVTGGNKRGANAVDNQTSRTSASEVASGIHSGVLSGRRNTASGQYAHVGGGTSNTAGNDNASVIGGQFCTASGLNSIAGGDSCSATGQASVALGKNPTASAYGSVAMGGEYANASGYAAIAIGNGTQSKNSFALAMGFRSSAYRNNCFSWAGQTVAGSNTGIAQYEKQQLYRQTTDASVTELLIDTTPTRITLQTNSTYAFSMTIVGRRIDATLESAAWKVEGLIHRNAATTAFVGTPTTVILGDTSAGAWTIAVTANDTTDSLEVRVTGQVGKTIRWTAIVDMVLVSTNDN